jgi:hypothetical protein
MNRPDTWRWNITGTEIQIGIGETGSFLDAARRAFAAGSLPFEDRRSDPIGSTVCDRAAGRLYGIPIIESGIYPAGCGVLLENGDLRLLLFWLSNGMLVCATCDAPAAWTGPTFER